ncbi:MAG: TnsA endonuclease N-terminal domain-containing protein [Gallionella sp.]|nr:TnsA endonuclease N-terminal domain-containing protein [Gallionella sp.]
MDKEIFVSDTVDVYLEPWLRELVGGKNMPARKIRPSRYSVTGYVPSSKGTKAQDAESSLEQDFLTLLEYDKRVERYVAQPLSITWTDSSGKRHRYTPDAIVKYSYSAMCDDPHLRTTIFEVKPRAILMRDWLELKPKLRSAIGWAKEFGCRFHLVTEKEIRTPYLANVRFLLDYYNRHLPERQDLIAARQHLVIETLHKLKRTTPRDLLQAMTQNEQLQAELIPWIWNLLNMEFIGVDLTKPLTMVSPIWETEKTKLFLQR